MLKKNPFIIFLDSSINKGDLVWVKYRGAPFWPAVVCKIKPALLNYLGNM